VNFQAVEEGEVGDDLDLSEIPPSPPPYQSAKSTVDSVQHDTDSQVKQLKVPRTLLEGLEQLLSKYKDSTNQAKADGNDRKYRYWIEKTNSKSN